MRPMLATRGPTPPHGIPTGGGWAHEVKWDGMRALVRLRGGRVEVRSRSDRNVSVGYPELAPLGDVHGSLLLDGEIVRLVEGRPSFAAMQERMHVSSASVAARLASVSPVMFMVFDVLEVDGLDVTGLPWTQRRAALETLVPTGPAWAVAEVYDDGLDLWEATGAAGIEGIVSKRRDAPYTPGVRSTAWLKFPHRPAASYVVGGWRWQTGTTDRLGAVLVGLPSNGGLEFKGRVGSGLAGAAGERLLDRIRTLRAEDSPFVTAVPRADALGAVWMRPEVVVDVVALGEGSQGRLRQPAYVGWRPDLSPADISV